MHIKEVVIYENNKIGNPDLFFIRYILESYGTIEMRISREKEMSHDNKYMKNTFKSLDQFIFWHKMQMNTIRRHTVTHIPH